MTSAPPPGSGPRTRTVPTPNGDARVHVHEPRGRCRSVLVLGHGAGGGVDARDLAALAVALPPRGHRVVLVEQPWRVAGRKVAGPPSTLDTAWCAVVDALRADGTLAGLPLVVGGRSAGARVACRTADRLGADGVLALAFPLHPPGRPERSRADELAGAGAGAPVLVVQGGRDPFGTPEEVRAAVPGVDLFAVPAADHGFRVLRAGPCTQAEAESLISEAVVRRLARWATTGTWTGDQKVT